MKNYVTQIRNRNALLSVVSKQLRSHGIKAAKAKKPLMRQSKKESGKIFGSLISYLPSVIIDYEKEIMVPKILVDITSALDERMHSEGLFRKSGSLARQRELRKCIENGQVEIQSANVYDLASLLKQFLRELPEPLICTHLQEAFVKAQNLDISCRLDNLLMLCLLLPVEQVNVLKFIMTFLMRVASYSELNKMGISNLAIVMTPNLMHHPDSNAKKTKIIQLHTDIVSTLITHAEEIGMIPDYILEKMSSLKSKSPVDSETKSSDSFKRKKKRRSSINGVFNSIRRRVHRPVSNESEDSSLPLPVFVNPEETPCNEKLTNGIERNSSKRKADSLSPEHVKKKAFKSDDSKMLFTSENSLISQGTGEARLHSGLTSKVAHFSLVSPVLQFSLGTPLLNFSNGLLTDQTFTSCGKDVKEHFKTPKIKSKYGKFFSPRGLIKRRNNVSTSVSPFYCCSSSEWDPFEYTLDPKKYPVKITSSLRRGRPNTVGTGLIKASNRVENELNKESPSKNISTVDSSDNVTRKMSPIPISFCNDTMEESTTSEKIGFMMKESGKSEFRPDEEIKAIEEKGIDRFNNNFKEEDADSLMPLNDNQFIDREVEEKLQNFTKNATSQEEEKFGHSNSRKSKRRSQSNRSLKENIPHHFNGIDDHKCAVIAPLTNDTYAILSKAGILTNDDETVKSMDLEPVWRPASTVITTDPKEMNLPPCGRPSLLMLKTEKAGMVSANIRKYNMLAHKRQLNKCTERNSPTTPPTVGSVNNKPNSVLATIPASGYVRRQNLRNSNKFPRSVSYTSTPKISPTCQSSTKTPNFRLSLSTSSLEVKSQIRPNKKCMTSHQLIRRAQIRGILLE